MPYTIAAVLSLVALAGGLTAWHRIRHLRRVILRERAAARLAGAANQRDMDAFRHRIDQAIAQQRVLEEADAIVDRELARTTRNTSQEGDLP
ncbi:hypothetical protein ACWGRL_05075 [[Kitasatospora] papulosa]